MVSVKTAHNTENTMRFFLDTAEINEIRKHMPTGLVNGVTTNPSLIARSGRKMSEVIAEIAEVVAGPVSAEVVATETSAMIKEGQYLASISEHVVVKVPLTVAGIEACTALSREGIAVNVTLCFSAAQALLAAKAGARYISPFVGRLDDIGEDGMSLISDIVTMYAAQGFATEVLVASVRGVRHVVDAATLGADVVTLPPKVLGALFGHPLTEKGLAAFLSDWEKTGQSIL